MNNIINVNNISYEYITEESTFKAIDNLNLDVKQGEFVAIIGHNGSGKSTLSKNLNAILMPTKGNILIDGNDTKDEEKLWDIRQTAGMVFQNPDNQIVATIVEEDVAFGPENLGVEPKLIRKRVEEGLKSVGIYELKDRQPHLLSGGQKALTSIALLFAILKVRTVPFCVLDEVEAALDEANVARYANYLKAFSNETQFIVITHRKGTMEKADVLYGVTMQERGVTKLVSVRMDNVSDYMDDEK